MKPYQDESWGKVQAIDGVGGVAAIAAPQSQGAAAPAVPKQSLLQLAWRRKFLMLGCLVGGLAIGLIYCIVVTPLYTATATVEVTGLNTNFMGMDRVEQQNSLDLVASLSNIQTQVKLLTSRALLRRVLQRMRLESAPVSAPPPTFFTHMRSLIPFLRENPLESTNDALSVAVKKLTASAVGTTRLVEISTKTTSPQLAANFVNTLAAEHVAQSLATRTASTQKTSQWLDSQLEESKSKLDQAAANLRDFVQKSGMDFFPEQNTLADSKLRNLQGDVAGVQADRISKQSRWEMARSTPIENLPDVVSDPTLQALKGQIQGLKRDIAQLTATLTPEHYKVQRVQAQLTEAERAFEKERAGVLLRLKSDYEEAQRREGLLVAAYNKQTGALSAQTGKSAEYAMLRREVETQQTMYNMLMTQSSQASLNSLAPANNIRLADPATPQILTSMPVPPRDIPVAGVVGLLLGLGWVWLREDGRRKKSILLFDAPGHTSTVLGVPELGVIPSAMIQQPKITLMHRLTSRSEEPASEEEVSPAGVRRAGVQTALAGLQTDKSTLLAESFRQTLVSLLRTTPKDHNPVYVITSAYPGEGKTTLTANLASAMADIGKRVLLVDADLRRASVHAVSGTRKDHIGLSDILSSEEALKDIRLDEYLQPTRNENLKVLTHGVATVETPALLFFSPRVQQLVSLLQSQFDCVIFDTAPALTFPDARLWGRQSDGVVLVVRSGVTTREGASACCQRFLEDGIPVLGTILNDWAPSEKSKQAYAYYAAAVKPAV